jgi:hypothetical protein
MHSEPSIPDAAPTPALSILDLMLWTLATAVAVSASKSQLALRGDSLVGKVFSVVWGCLVGIAMAAVIRLIARWQRGEYPVLAQPGHWLLWNAGLAASVGCVVRFFMAWYSIRMNLSPGSREAYELNLVGVALWLTAACVLNAGAGRLLQGGGTFLWSRFFLFRTVTCGLLALYYATESWFYLPSLRWSLYSIPALELVALAICVRHDRGLRRDWLHFAGVGVQSGLCLLNIASWLSYWFRR